MIIERIFSINEPDVFKSAVSVNSDFPEKKDVKYSGRWIVLKKWLRPNIRQISFGNNVVFVKWKFSFFKERNRMSTFDLIYYMLKMFNCEASDIGIVVIDNFYKAYCCERD